MKSKMSQIYEGWKNHLHPEEHLKEIIESTKIQRLKICRTCSFHSSRHYTPFRPDEHCTNCGCTLSAKTACLSCKCPLPQPKWEAVVTEEEQEKMKENGQ